MSQGGPTMSRKAIVPVELFVLSNLNRLNRLNRCLKVEPEHNQKTCASLHHLVLQFLKPAKEGRPSTWEHPMDQVYRELLGVIRQASSTSPAKSREESPGDPRAPNGTDQREPKSGPMFDV